MHRLLLLLVFISPILHGQSKSIRDFRSDFKESNNVFLYRSTLRMLNTENNPEFAEVLSGIDEIMVLNYEKGAQRYTPDDMVTLKKNLEGEGYEMLMKVTEKGYGIDLMGKQKKNRNNGMVAIMENSEAMVLIDISGNVDMARFMELWQKIDAL